MNALLCLLSIICLIETLLKIIGIVVIQKLLPSNFHTVNKGDWRKKRERKESAGAHHISRLRWNEKIAVLTGYGFTVLL